jgi:hypothetical protein
MVIKSLSLRNYLSSPIRSDQLVCIQLQQALLALRYNEAQNLLKFGYFCTKWNWTTHSEFRLYRSLFFFFLFFFFTYKKNLCLSDLFAIIETLSGRFGLISIIICLWFKNKFFLINKKKKKKKKKKNLIKVRSYWKCSTHVHQGIALKQVILERMHLCIL